jgi:hypothetical protein
MHPWYWLPAAFGQYFDLGDGLGGAVSEAEATLPLS